jgi:hypothetical protein
MRPSHVSEPKRSRYFRSTYSYCCSLALLAASAALAQENPAQPPRASASTAAATASATKNPELGWLKGKWVFDQEFTEKKYSESKPAEGLTALANGLVYPQLVSKLKGSNVSFQEGEMIMTTADGNGKAYAITVIDPPDSDSVTIKDKDGEVTTYHKEGERFWMASTGNVNIPFYFKQAPGQ